MQTGRGHWAFDLLLLLPSVFFQLCFYVIGIKEKGKEKKRKRGHIHVVYESRERGRGCSCVKLRGTHQKKKRLQFAMQHCKLLKMWLCVRVFWKKKGNKIEFDIFF